MAMPSAACQPMCGASRGATSVHTTVPALPAPAMPMATPWDPAGYQRLASGMATAKLPPATPSSAPTPSSSGTFDAASHPQINGITETSRLTEPTRRGPKRSARMPITTRATAAATSGVPTTMPMVPALR
jgi:hypothetical protein